MIRLFVGNCIVLSVINYGYKQLHPLNPALQNLEVQIISNKVNVNA